MTGKVSSDREEDTWTGSAALAHLPFAHPHEIVHEEVFHGLGLVLAVGHLRPQVPPTPVLLLGRNALLGPGLLALHIDDRVPDRGVLLLAGRLDPDMAEGADHLLGLGRLPGLGPGQ